MEAVCHLIKNRTDAGVHSQNKHALAQMYKDSLGHFDGCKAIKNVAKSVSFEKPHLISSTRIRKELAIILQTFNMHDCDCS